MRRKPAPKSDDPEQSKRFIETAEKVGADDEDALTRVFEKLRDEKPLRDKKTNQSKTKFKRSQD